ARIPITQAVESAGWQQQCEQKYKVVEEPITNARIAVREVEAVALNAESVGSLAALQFQPEPIRCHHVPTPIYTYNFVRYAQRHQARRQVFEQPAQQPVFRPKQAFLLRA